MGKVILSGVSKGMTIPIAFNPVFSKNSWETIIKVCQAKIVPDTWTVGSSKTMLINGETYEIDIIGKNHDTYSDGSGTAPLTFQMKNCYAEEKQMNSSDTSSGGWDSCTMRTTYLPDILSKMPSEVQNGIRQVDKIATIGTRSTTLKTSADKLFLLSEIEIFGSVKHSYSGEGTQYDYYKAGNSRVKKRHNTALAIQWWGRSPYNANDISFCFVDGINATTNATAATVQYGISFAFCF